MAKLKELIFNAALGEKASDNGNLLLTLVPENDSYKAYTTTVSMPPIASKETAGIIKIGDYLTITNSDTLSVTPDFSGAQVKAESFNVTSDARLKENFQPLTLEKSILDLPTYKFEFINGEKNQIGCKAQDLQKICPEIVDEGSDGYLSIQESKIVYLLLEEVKKLKKEVDELRGI